jgi:two-component system cell cycle sensor histidine kinase/response regulator CckA
MNHQTHTNQELIEEISILKQKIKELEQFKLEHHQVIDALRESEEKYRIIAENTVDLISIVDMNLRFTYISPSVLRTRGLTVEEALTQTLDQVLTPESLQYALDIFTEEMELESSGTGDPGRIRILELEEYKKDGSKIWLESSFSFLRDKNGKATGIIAVARDISDRKKVEAQLKQQREFIDTVLDSIPGILYVYNETSHLIRWNKQHANMTGYSADEMKGRHVLD